MNDEFDEKTGEMFLGGANPQAVKEFNNSNDEITEDELEAIFAGNLNRDVAVAKNLEHAELFRDKKVIEEQEQRGR